jgi:type II secretory pathway component PulF
MAGATQTRSLRTSAPPMTVTLKSKKHKGIKGDDIIAFFQQLSTLLTAGTPLLRSIQVAGAQSESFKLIALIHQIASEVASGSPLNEAMTRHPKIFEYQWIEMIKAGERSGTLAETINELTIYIKTRRAVRGQVVSAMIYPIIMICVLVAALILMLGKVVPTFAEFLTDFGQQLPAITLAVIAASEFVQTHIPHLVFGPIGVVVSLRYYFKTEKGARRKEAIMLKIPLIGQLVVDSTMERFAHNLALLLKSGTPLLGALKIMPELFRNQGVYGPSFAWVYQNVGKGVSLAASLERTGLFTPMVVSMVTVGEESGTLTTVLHEIATFYRAKVEVLVHRVTGMMEPIIVIFMGASVGVILMSIYLPMFQMAGGPQG